MESRNKLAMCRLCLCENEFFINVFELNYGHGYIAAEVISDLLQFQVSETDGYTHVVCSKCLIKLTDFKLFKECCHKSIVKYDNMFATSESLEEHQPEMLEFVTVKAEPILYSDDLDNISKEIYDPDVTDGDEFKEEPVEDVSGDVSGSGFCEKDPLVEASSDMEFVAVKAEPLSYSEYEDNFTKNMRPQCTSKGAVDADSHTRNISTQSAFNKSKNISLSVEVEASSCGTKESLEKHWISSGERMCTGPLVKEDIGVEVEKEEGRKKKLMSSGEKGGRRTTPEKVAEGERKPLECFHCGTVLMSKSSLLKHMLLHGFHYTFDCDVCGKAFQSKYGVIRHALTHTGCSPHKCTECSKCFGAESNLKQHMRLHTVYKCSECRKCFSDDSSLEQHMRSHTESKEHKCAECSKCFSDNSNLKRHMRLHTGTKPYKCIECSKCFSRNSDLKNHMITHTGSKPYKCTGCSKSFSDNSNLRRHMRLHIGSRPYKCSECSKSFNDNNYLTKHMISHRF